MTPPLYTLPLTLALSVTHLTAAVFSGLPQHPRPIFSGLPQSNTNSCYQSFFPLKLINLGLYEFTLSLTYGLNPLVTSLLSTSFLPWMHFGYIRRVTTLLSDRRREVGRNEEGRSWPVEPLRLSVSAILSPCFCCCCCCRPGTGELPDAPPSLSSPAIAAAIQEIYLV